MRPRVFSASAVAITLLFFSTSTLADPSRPADRLFSELSRVVQEVLKEKMADTLADAVTVRLDSTTYLLDADVLTKVTQR